MLTLIIALQMCVIREDAALKAPQGQDYGCWRHCLLNIFIKSSSDSLFQLIVYGSSVFEVSRGQTNGNDIVPGQNGKSSYLVICMLT